MYCQKCGKENEEGAKFCLYCGATLMPNNSAKPKKKKRWIIPLVLIICILGLLFMCLIGGSDSEETEKTITKLSKITSVTQEDNRVLFNYNDAWVINYNEDAQTVKIKDENIYNCFAESFESEEIGNNGEFLYNWNENQLHAYVDYDEKDGNISIIKYSLDKEEWTLMVDDEWYGITDEFQKYLDDYGIVDIMKSDVKSFEKDLESVGLSIEDLKVLNYNDIVQYYKDHPEAINKKTETVTEVETEESSEVLQHENLDKNEGANETQNYDSPIGKVIQFYQNGDENNSGEMQLMECYQGYDESYDKDVIVIHVHMKNTGNNDIVASSSSFSMYGDNKILEMSYGELTSLPFATISPGREVDGSVAFEANNSQFNTIELEFAEISIPLKNDKINVFEYQPKNSGNEDYNSVITEKSVRESLGVPEDADVSISYSEEYYWRAGEINVTNVSVEGVGKDEGHFARASFDVSNGEMANNILMWN